MPKKSSGTLADIIRQAVHDVVQNGFSWDRLKLWQGRIEMALQIYRSTTSSERRISKGLLDLFLRKTSPIALSKVHKGVDRITLSMIATRSRSLLDDRIMASADLIRLNRERSIARTLDRFSGWATSIPTTGSSQNVGETISHIAKPLRSMSFEERRLFIDQGHKLISNVNHVIALQTDAIAGMWRHVHQANYDGRPEHEALDGKWFVFKDGWAYREGFITKGDGFIEEIEEMPAMAPFCRCWMSYSRGLRTVPVSLLTAKGRKAFEEAKVS